MKLDQGFLRSKVARRVFTLFLVAAIVPTLTLGFFAFREVNTQLNQQIAQQLHGESKMLGMAVLQRLQAVESEMRSVGNRLLQAHRPLRESVRLESFSEIIKSLTVADLAAESPPLKEEERSHLGQGKGLLSIDRQPGQAPRLIMRQLIDPTRPEKGILRAEIDRSGAFDFPQGGGTGFCITDAPGRLLLCSDEQVREIGQSLPIAVNTRNSGWFDWQLGGETQRAAYWVLFLKPFFLTPSWTILVSKPAGLVLAQADSFKQIFPPVMALSLLLVIGLSLTQIRRFLVPLEKLRVAAANIAVRRFKQSVVEIHSGDEFEDLASAFNSMAVRLDKQFDALAAMAEIDRSILSALDKQYIIEILVTRLRQVIDCDLVAVTVTELDHTAKAMVYLGTRQQAMQSFAESVALAAEDLKALGSGKLFDFKLIGKAALPDFLASLPEHGIAFAWVFPIMLQQQPAGVIALGYRQSPQLDDDELTQAKNLAGRAAVALSNAAWQEQLYQQAHYDALTGLPNRMLLKDRLDQALKRAEREHLQVAVMFIDLDRFKLVNDSLGHPAGDALLVQVGGILQSCIRNCDTVARLGGDEFMLIVPDIARQDDLLEITAKITENIFRKLRAPFLVAQQEVFMGASIGIAVFPKDADNADDLLRHADSAMYHAKALGRNNFQFYSPPLNDKTLKRLKLETDLRRALERDELRLHYQPQVTSTTQQLVGAEALLRWEHPEKGMISPAEFIPLAEESGLIIPIGEWVLRTVCAQSMQWQRQGLRGLRIAVNLSARQFNDQNLLKQVWSALSTSGLAAKKLELEITEGATMENPERTKNMLHAFKEIGIALSVDDFGTGYSSLSYLRQFPIDTLKVDQSFIRTLPTDADSAAIVTAIIALAHSMNFSAIAEGVETEEQLRFLQNQKCEQIQGYLISKPLPPEQFAERFLLTGEVVGGLALSAQHS